MVRFTTRCCALLVLSLALLTAMVPASSLAQVPPATAACVGHGYKVVRRTDGTSFKNPGECLKYVKDDGTLIAGPRMVIDVYYRDEDHCEFTVDLYGMTPGTRVPVTIVHPVAGLQTIYTQIGTDGSTWYPTGGGTGAGFSIPIEHTVTVTAEYTELGSTVVLTQDVRC